jgi:hypothetical protein
MLFLSAEGSIFRVKRQPLHVGADTRTAGPVRIMESPGITDTQASCLGYLITHLICSENEERSVKWIQPHRLFRS